jgi:hypothetical protein
MRKGNGFNPQFNNSIDERNTMDLEKNRTQFQNEFKDVFKEVVEKYRPHPQQLKLTLFEDKVFTKELMDRTTEVNKRYEESLEVPLFDSDGLSETLFSLFKELNE